jgi:hypothetical protein
MMSKSRCLVLLYAAMVASLCLPIAAYARSSHELAHSTLPANERVLPGTTTLSHDSIVADSETWSVTTYTDSLNEACITDVVPHAYSPTYEGGSLDCFSKGTIFQRSPVFLSSSGRPDPSNPREWSELWFYGQASPTITKLTLIANDCAATAVPLDATGVFLDVIGASALTSGGWPNELKGYNSAGQVVYDHVFHLPEPPEVTATSSGTQALTRTSGPAPNTACS